MSVAYGLNGQDSEWGLVAIANATCGGTPMTKRSSFVAFDPPNSETELARVHNDRPVFILSCDINGWSSN